MALLFYIFRRSLLVTALASGGLLLFYFLVDYVESSALVGASSGGYCPSRLLGASVQILPAAIALGSSLSVGMLKRSGEWEAMQIAGLGPTHLFGAIGSVAVLGAVLSACLGLVGAPECAPVQNSGSAGGALRGAAPRGHWMKKGNALVHCSEGAPLEIVQRDAAGRFLGAAVGALEIAQLEGDVAGLCAADSAAIHESSDPTGGGLSYMEMGAAIQTRRDLGLSARGLLVQRALRQALVLACLLAPYLAYWAIFRFRPVSLAGHGWLALASVLTVTLAILVPYQLALGGWVSQRWMIALQLGLVVATLGEAVTRFAISKLTTGWRTLPS